MNGSMNEMMSSREQFNEWQPRAVPAYVWRLPTETEDPCDATARSGFILENQAWEIS